MIADQTINQSNKLLYSWLFQIESPENYSVNIEEEISMTYMDGVISND